MRITILIFALSAVLFSSCTSRGTKQTEKKDATDGRQAAPNRQAPCEHSESLVYDHNGFSTYTEDRMHGSGVISFHLEINDRLDIYNLDDATFGHLVYNEDGTFYTSSMPKKLVARSVVPEADFARFDFDAEPVEAGADYLFIYANGRKLKVRKTDLKYTFSKWDDYLRSQVVALKACNLLAEAVRYPDMLFEVTELKGDRIKIRSSRPNSGPEVNFKPVEGWIKWKKNNLLLVDLQH